MLGQRAKVPRSSRLAMARALSVGNSIVGPETPGNTLPQHDMVGWTKTLALRRLIAANMPKRLGCVRIISAPNSLQSRARARLSGSPSNQMPGLVIEVTALAIP